MTSNPMGQEGDLGSTGQYRGMYLFLENPSKSNNLGPVLRCASAFGIRTVVAVGYSTCAVEGSHGASNHVEIIAFPTSSQASTYLRDECDCQVIMGLLGGIPDGYHRLCVRLNRRGVDSNTRIHAVVDDDDMPGGSPKSENVRESIPVGYDSPDLSMGATGNVAIAVSKHVDGLPFQLAQHCDAFLHVPHVGIPNNEIGAPPPSNLLDLPSTLSISLHHIAISLQHQEGTSEGHKFHVARNKSLIPAAKADNQKRENRANKRLLLDEEKGDMGFGAFTLGDAADGSDY